MKKNKKLKQGICRYCKSEINIFNKFHDVYTCKNCFDDRKSNKVIGKFFFTDKQRADYDPHF